MTLSEKQQMALKAQNKKPSRAVKNSKNPMWIPMGVVGVGACVTLLAFLSMELAILAVGYLGICVFALADQFRRNNWEKAHSFKILQLGKNQDRLTREVSRQKDDVAALKEAVAQTNMKLEEQAHKISVTHEVEQKTAPKTEMIALAAPARKQLAPKKKKGTAFHELSDEQIIPKTFRRKKKPVLTGKSKTNKYFEDYESLSDMVVTELIHNSLQDERIEVFVQPVVRLPQRKIRFYEVFGRVRARAGVYIPASRYSAVAEKEDVANELDSLLLMECLKTLHRTAHIENATPFFVNVSSKTLRNGAFMKRLLAFVSRHRNLTHRLVLEVRQSDFEDMHPAVLEILRGLTTLGCSLSLDHVSHFDLDLRFLQTLKVRYIKARADHLMKARENFNGLPKIMKIKRQLESNGIAFIVERIEDEHTLKELLDFDIHYGQGFLFGRPELQGVYQQKSAA